MSEQKKIHIFGVTGSIGENTADIILAHPDVFNVQVVSAQSNVDKLAEMATRLKARYAVIGDESLYDTLKQRLAGTGVQPAAGRQALLDHAALPADIAMMAIVGMAGLEPMLRAMDGSRAVAIANKEPLVAAGPIVMAKAREKGVTILPVDSEHNAIFQVFEERNRAAIRRIILTASGGPFWGWSHAAMMEATRAQALAHPNWVMGAKISIDSATMMNKALEVIEAHYLFDMPAAQIDVMIHPQSVIHSMVEYQDGSVLAQMGASDMRTPIANILSYPERLKTSGNSLNFNKIMPLTFFERDDVRFPFIPLAYESLSAGLHHCIGMNAANEVAVEAFLQDKLGFGDIINCVTGVVDSITGQKVAGLEDVLSLDGQARAMAHSYIQTVQTNKAVSTL